MNIQVNQLAVDVFVSPQINQPDDLAVTVTFTNQGENDLQLTVLFHQSPTTVLKIRSIDLGPILSGPPPVPPIDDGQVGRKVLAPGESIALTYKGRDYLQGLSLPPGIYQVKFRYENTISEYNDWTGSIESEWLNFEVGPLEEESTPEAG